MHPILAVQPYQSRPTGDKDDAEDQRREPVLPLDRRAGGPLLGDVVRRRVPAEQAQQESDSETEVGEAGGFGLEAVLAAKYEGEGGEQEEEIAVYEGHLEGQKEDNRRSEQHLHGPEDGSVEQILGCLALGGLGNVVVISGFLPEPRGFHAQDCWRVGFTYEKDGTGQTPDYF